MLPWTYREPLDPKITTMIHLAGRFPMMDIEDYMKEFNYWFKEYDKEICRWEDDGGCIL
jgi:hypothetical protein